MVPNVPPNGAAVGTHHPESARERKPAMGCYRSSGGILTRTTCQVGTGDGHPFRALQQLHAVFLATPRQKGGDPAARKPEYITSWAFKGERWVVLWKLEKTRLFAQMFALFAHLGKLPHITATSQTGASARAVDDLQLKVLGNGRKPGLP